MKILTQMMLALLMCAASVQAAGDDGVAAAGGGVEIKQGKERKVAGAGLKIAFLSVVEDSRCPVGVQCIWAGNARVRLRVSDSKGKRAEVELNTYSQPLESEFAGYKIKLAKLRPARSSNKRIVPHDYAATLIVTKSKT